MTSMVDREFVVCLKNQVPLCQSFLGRYKFQISQDLQVELELEAISVLPKQFTLITHKSELHMPV